MGHVADETAGSLGLSSGGGTHLFFRGCGSSTGGAPVHPARVYCAANGKAVVVAADERGVLTFTSNPAPYLIHWVQTRALASPTERSTGREVARGCLIAGSLGTCSREGPLPARPP